MRRTWIVALAVLLLSVGICYYASQEHNSDVSDQFRSIIATQWCVTADHFILKASDTGILHASRDPGEMTEVRAFVAKGTRFRVTKVVKNYDPGFGIRIIAYVTFEGPARTFGELEASRMQSIRSRDLDRVKFEAATGCR